MEKKNKRKKKKYGIVKSNEGTTDKKNKNKRNPH